MTTHVLHAEILKPKALDPASWSAIRDCFDRLQEAARTNDRPLVIGSAKDLVEATARVVLDSRGQPAGSNEEYDKVLNAAHRAIERQPGPGLSADAAVRQAANAAKKLAVQLRELRNSYGTGHGRSTLPPIEDEVIETCVDGALLWTRWALRRLQFLIIGSVQQLVTDLHNSTFSMGELAIRLQAANLPDLLFEDQRLLGVAVGQRAATNTFTVRIDGVEACAVSQDDAAWPVGYREGVADGLFLDSTGQIRVDTNVFGPRLTAQLLVPHPRQVEVLRGLADKIRSAAWSTEFRGLWRRVVEEMHAADAFFQQEGAKGSWLDIAEHIKATGKKYEAAAGA
ncbi:abortive infection family protein [Streptomyces caniscabiei]|uniref:Abortive infection family protein n=1 Tax=Streptomyces caniscabiei TaxID=2746961 RepID=A0A927LFW2_9ACTN|nr:abortive infection family protein [Streptomyces caniscabiei]MBD9730104.1 abortive infection family protein [Streptomyces caniscabiei]MDX3515929.1 abortive infection family protein [Streptomyces caniscabiei]MDX3725109.1 abortive infection family protein [Streptomyces caniscabiei]WEO21680.1 abortive infection family protein [Streptomyces caniscabiei]